MKYSCFILITLKNGGNLTFLDAFEGREPSYCDHDFFNIVYDKLTKLLPLDFGKSM